MPVLILVAEKDHITPPDAAIPFYEKIPSKDKLMLTVNKAHRPLRKLPFPQDSLGGGDKLDGRKIGLIEI